MNLTIKKIYHNEADQIGVFFPFDFNTKEFCDKRYFKQLVGHSRIKNHDDLYPSEQQGFTRIQSPLDSLNLNLEMKKNEKKVE